MEKNQDYLLLGNFFADFRSKIFKVNIQIYQANLVIH